MKWRQMLIGDFVATGEASIQTGPFGTQLAASSYVEHGIPVINVRNIGYGTLRAEKLEFVNDSTADRLSVHSLEIDDIVFGRKGAVDRHYLVNAEGKGWIQGSDCIRLRLVSDRVLAKYVSLAFLHRAHLQWMLTQSGNKATMASLNQDIIKRIPITVPPLPTQRRIAEILSAYDDLIENNQRRMKLLEESARMLYQEWFVRLRFPGHEHTKIVDGVPEGWARQKIGDLCSKIGSGATPRGGEAAYQVDGISLIRSQNVYDDKFDEDGLAKISEEQAKLLESVSVYSRDILLNITGASVARCCMAPDRHLPARVNQHVMIIRVRDDVCSPFFVHAAINSETNKKRLLAIARAGGATREALTKDAVASFEVVVPKASLSNEFHRVVALCFEQHEKLEESNKKLRTARDLLLPRLMNGEVEA